MLGMKPQGGGGGKRGLPDVPLHARDGCGRDGQAVGRADTIQVLEEWRHDQTDLPEPSRARSNQIKQGEYPMARGRAGKTGSDIPNQPAMVDIVGQGVEDGKAPNAPAGADQPSQAELLDRVFREPSSKRGLRFFRGGERPKLRFRLSNDGKVQIRCLNATLGSEPNPKRLSGKPF